MLVWDGNGCRRKLEPRRQVKLQCHGRRLIVTKCMILEMMQPFNDKENQDEDSATVWFSQFFWGGRGEAV